LQKYIFPGKISLFDDVSKLNRKRGTKKTTIIKGQNFLDKLDSNHENWSISDLVKNFDGLYIGCKQYIIVAELVAVIEELDFDADYDSQIAENTAVLISFEKQQIIYLAYFSYVNLMECLESIHSQ